MSSPASMPYSATASSPSTASLGSVVIQPTRVPPPPLNYYWGSIVLGALSVILLGILAFLAASDGASGAAIGMLAVFGVPMAIVAAVMFVRRSRKACVLTLYERGYTVDRKGRLDVVEFDAIDSVTLKEKMKLNNGVAAGLERAVESRGAFGMVRFEHFARNEDPTERFATAIIERAAASAQKKVSNGRPLQGTGWTLDTRGITLANGETTSLASVTEFAGVDMKLAFWRHDEPEPFLSVPHNSPNVFVLLEIVRPHAAKNSETPRTVSGLGRVLFERKQRMAGIIIALLFGIGLLATVIGILADDHSADGLVIAGVCLIPCLILVGWSIHAIKARKRFHERGVTVISLFGQREILYSDVVRFSWNATRNYVNGAYAGTSIKAKIVPQNGKPVSMGFNISGEDETLDTVRQQIAVTMAARWEAALDRGERVAWGTDATFTRDRLEHRPPKLIGKSDARSSGYKDGLRVTIENGIFNLFIRDEPKSALRIGCGTENFWPGMALLERMANR
jgi:hypothetical protein